MPKANLFSRRRLLTLGAASIVQPAALGVQGPTLQVGPMRAVKSLAAAARQAAPGTTIAVDAGDYRGDVAVWTRDDIRLHANGGRVRLVADGAAAEGKGIWVVRAWRMRVEGFDFEGAVVGGHNGAGIRLESGSLNVRDCSFTHNQMGLLTNNDAATELDVENCEFARNQRPDGHNHNLYVGQIKRLSVTGSYLHHSLRGHLLKSRAAYNFIGYNRLTDETDGGASYELEFPNGGIAHVVGNIVQQSVHTDNPHLISFGAEGYRGSDNEIFLAHNTLVDDLPGGGVWLRVREGAQMIRIVNNLLAGRARWDVDAGAELRNNVTLDRAALAIQGPDAFRARGIEPARLRAVEPGAARGVALSPGQQYVHPRHTVALTAPARFVGALQETRPNSR
jgi:hypothetical protein